MKTVITCLNCGKLKRFSNTYKVKAEISRIYPLSGERKLEEVVGRMCADCAYDAGYKVRKNLLAKREGGEKI